ncbi:SAV_915 family protein [Streptomyces sp. NPDC060194]|uniref:SAV_915 family protein n=1 Tax=Streptomyces sp. NPDC060194 TaxID=3347069 RepID=UPI00364F8903
MCLFRYDDDPDPDEQAPVGLLHVPVRITAAGTTLRVFRTPLGERTAVGFTRPELLTATLGDSQPAVRLAESAVRALTGPLGVTRLVVDPTLSAPAAAATTVRAVRQPVAALHLVPSEETPS